MTNVMKIFRYALAAMILTAVCGSCDLDQTPRDKVTPDTFFKTATDLELFTNDCYLNCMPSAANLYQNEYDAVIESPMPDVVTGQRIVPDADDSFRRWGWSALRQINFYLAHSHQCEDADARKQYDGVARFFRALFYYTKIKTYGDVPWYDQVMESDDPALYKARDPREYVMQMALEDIDYAITNLSPTKELYRVTRWTAMALKSRMCLFEGTFRKYHGLPDYEKYLEQCAAISETFINTSGYSIYSLGTAPYQGLFSSLNAIPTEVILARDYNASLSLLHNVQGFLNSQGSANVGLTKRMVDAYLMRDGGRFTDRSGWETRGFYEEVQNRDPRLAQTIRVPGGSLGLPNLGFNRTGYHLTKYYIESKYDGYNSSEVDMPVFRAAEVYLNFAEAKAELGTLTQNDLEKSVNKLRTRVGMTGLDMAAANASPDPYLYSKTPLANGQVGMYQNVDINDENLGVILEIRRERGVEMIMEGLRFDDLVRWKEGAGITQPYRGIYFPGPGEYDLNNDGRMDVCIYEGTRPTTSATYVWKIGEDIELTDGNKGNLVVPKPGTGWNEERDYFYPIPSGERILNNALTQNPGWNDGLSF